MATYVIGDLQGCFQSLERLLEHIGYDVEQDYLWFAGDVVNRGPDSLACLRFVKSLCEQRKAAMVLGNHDFHLLAAYAGLEKFVSKSDTLQPILQAPDSDELINWLRHQPLLVRHDTMNAVMVHAGIPPQWTITEALTLAREAEAPLQGDDWKTFLTHHLFGNEPKKWHRALSEWERIRYIVNAFARMRYCDANGKLDFKIKHAPSVDELKESDSTTQKLPWFVFKDRKNRDHEIFFGHWSTVGTIDQFNVHSTDTGCLWGGSLTAYHLEENKRFQISCPQQMKPNIRHKK